MTGPRDSSLMTIAQKSRTGNTRRTRQRATSTSRQRFTTTPQGKKISNTYRTGNCQPVFGEDRMRHEALSLDRRSTMPTHCLARKTAQLFQKIAGNGIVKPFRLEK
jgi:hypothetical protein